MAAGGAGAGRKQVRQEELRRLMREKQRQNAGKKRIDSPFAKYPLHREIRGEGGGEGGRESAARSVLPLTGRHVQQPGAPELLPLQRARQGRAPVADTRPGQAAPGGERRARVPAGLCCPGAPGQRWGRAGLGRDRGGAAPPERGLGALSCSGQWERPPG